MAGGWIAVDLDGTAADDRGLKTGEIGAPVPLMAERIHAWLSAGRTVVIFTAREDQHEAIGDWTEQHFGTRLPVTNVKDRRMTEFWDDRAIPVERNTGRVKVVTDEPIADAAEPEADFTFGGRSVAFA